MSKFIASVAKSAARRNPTQIVKASQRLNFDSIPIEQQVVMMFPGLGVQKVGMGKCLMENAASAKLFEHANQILGYNLLDICLNGPKSKLDQTIYSSLAIFVCTMAALEKLKWEQTGLLESITDTAGMSSGEISALVLADVIDFEDGLRILQAAGESMHECSQLIASGMMVIGISAASQLDLALEEAKEEAKDRDEIAVCDVANHLIRGRKVVGGTKFCLDSVEQNASRLKYQIIKQLPVGGAFHTALMRPAEKRIDEVLSDINLRAPKMNVYSNYSGKLYSHRPQDIHKGIVRQISNPVKWEQIMQLLYRKHQDYRFPLFLEVGPTKQIGALLHEVSKKAYTNYSNYKY